MGRYFDEQNSISSLCYKTFFGGNLDFPKIKKLKKVHSDA